MEMEDGGISRNLWAIFLWADGVMVNTLTSESAGFWERKTKLYAQRVLQGQEWPT